MPQSLYCLGLSLIAGRGGTDRVLVQITGPHLSKGLRALVSPPEVMSDDVELVFVEVWVSELLPKYTMGISFVFCLFLQFFHEYMFAGCKRMHFFKVAYIIFTGE